jgi:hypothetical protein
MKFEPATFFMEKNWVAYIHYGQYFDFPSWILQGTKVLGIA